jgi:hypothetical protein
MYYGRTATANEDFILLFLGWGETEFLGTWVLNCSLHQPLMADEQGIWWDED